MIVSSQVAVGTGSTLVGNPTNQNVVLTTGTTAVTIGSTTSVTTSNGATLPPNSVVPLGRVTGPLYAVAASATTLGVIVTSPL